MKTLKFILPAIVVATFFAACGDNGNKKEKHEVIFCNQSDNLYKVRVVGEDTVDFFEVPGYQNITKEYYGGEYDVDITQKEGYRYKATKYEVELEVEGDKRNAVSWDDEEQW